MQFHWKHSKNNLRKKLDTASLYIIYSILTCAKREKAVAIPTAPIPTTDTLLLDEALASATGINKLSLTDIFP